MFCIDLKTKPKISKKLQEADESDDQDIQLDSNSDRIKKEKKVKEMMWPWVKASNAANNFDNRFKTQEKLLHEQHQMIKGIL